MIPTRFHRSAAAAALLCAAVGGLAGCAPLMLGGAMVGGGMVATDRRTTGTQIEDESIELKASSRVSDLATLGHINITSYNRLVLLTGEVPGEAEKVAAEKAVLQVENVRSVVNELALGNNSPMGSRSLDTVITGKVKATFLDAKDMQVNAYKVVTERGIVYLMGRVTEREATRGADLVSSISGVQKVVRVFDILTEGELAALGRASAATPAPNAASGASK